MKTFKRNDGFTDGEESTLKTALQSHPDDMPVLAYMDGIYTCFHNDKPGDCRVQTAAPYGWLEECDCLVFDVDER